ncbi:MAG: PorP/SprF family type IX secretion system membrane protein [Bacteroidales bacterium]|nr:PorP/SprF family type IX secretion system membrane protein [Bacteroidales bacterium]
MGKRPTVTILLLCTFLSTAKCQSWFSNPGFQSIIIVNPASAGAESDGILRMSFKNQYPDCGFGLYTASVSYDVYSSFLHGGLSGYVLNEYLGGVINDTRGGFSYSYHLKAGREFYVNAGLGAAIQNRAINRQKIILPDQIDPLMGAALPSSDFPETRGRVFFDIATGFLVTYRNYTGSFSINHLTKPDIEGSGSTESILKRQFSIYIFSTFYLDSRQTWQVKPLFCYESYGKNLLFAGGTVLTAGILSLNTLIMTNNVGDINMHTGLNFKKRKFLFFYNYCFNLSSANEMLPFSLYRQAGISINLNSVDKRKTINTINIPEL